MLATKKDLYDNATSPSLTFEQIIAAQANAASRLFDPRDLLGYTDEDWEYVNNGMICDLNEGYLIHTPRYINPDYDLLVKNGCKFLNIEPPKTLDELLDSLLIMYSHVPSITTFPVYIGNIDQLIDPFLTDVSDEEAYVKIRRFLNHVDKTCTDAFCHADIGPKATRAGYLILKAIVDLQTPVPNMTINYDENVTDEKFALACIDAQLRVSKPAFANHVYYTKDLGPRHAIVSCYNALPLAGGAYSLLRLRLGTIAKKAENTKDMVENLIVKTTKSILHQMDCRVDFLVNKSEFFKSSFLVKEGFIARENFTSMVAIVGLADAVNNLLQKEGLNETFGKSKRGDEIGLMIMDKIDEMVKAHDAPYVERTGGHYLLHAQVGASILEEDKDNTPAHRIKVGQEPDLPIHLNQAAQFHKYFPAGTGDLFAFDQTYLDHPAAVLDIIKGAFHKGMRYISCYMQNSDLIRVTGYLVKKSEVEKTRKNQTVLRNTAWFGKGTEDNAHVFERRTRS